MCAILRILLSNMIQYLTLCCQGARLVPHPLDRVAASEARGVPWKGSNPFCCHGRKHTASHSIEIAWNSLGYHWVITGWRKGSFIALRRKPSSPAYLERELRLKHLLTRSTIATMFCSQLATIPSLNVFWRMKATSNVLLDCVSLKRFRTAWCFLHLEQKHSAVPFGARQTYFPQTQLWNVVNCKSAERLLDESHEVQ